MSRIGGEGGSLCVWTYSQTRQRLKDGGQLHALAHLLRVHNVKFNIVSSVA
jgi:hypothetical protein